MPRGLGEVLSDIDRALRRLEHDGDARDRTRTLEHISRLTREALYRLSRAFLLSPPVL